MAGIGQTLLACPELTEEDLIGRVDVLDQFAAAASIANDMFFGPGNPPTIVQIPYAWLMPPVGFRPDAPYTSAAITQSGAGTAYTSDANSLDEYGDNQFAATLATLGAADTVALGEYTMTYYATQPGKVPRQRTPALVINLLPLDLVSIQTVLGLQEGQHIHVSGAPATWPEGTTDLVIEGISDAIGLNVRTRSLRTSPVIGSTPGTVGPWFRWGSSIWGGSDVIPF